MIGDKVIANRRAQNLQTRIHVSLKEVAHKKGEMPLNQPNFRYTNLLYNVKYKPSANKAFKDKPYLITSDILLKSSQIIRVKDYADFVRRSKANEEIAWLFRNTVHSKELFDLAKDNPGLYIPMFFDIVGYAKKVAVNEGKAEEDFAKIGAFLIQDLKEADEIRRKEYLESFNKRDVKIDI